MGRFGDVPQEVKPIAHLLKLGDEHEDRNIVVAYWARMGACLLALRIVPKQKSPETAKMITDILDWLEGVKRANQDNEGITNETTASALIEEYVLKMFDYADEQDQAEMFNKNTIKCFYTCGMLIDVLEQFGDIGDDMRIKRRYAKWKAAYLHTCLKNGDRPLPGPPRAYEDAHGIVPINTLTEEELKSYTKLVPPPNLSDAWRKPVDPNSPIHTNDFIPLIPANPSVDAHAPAPSPVTPNIPLNPTPFNTPSTNLESFDAPPSDPSVPFNIPSNSQPSSSTDPQPTDAQAAPNPEKIQQAQKFCKFATSALNYDDVENAMDYLTKAMSLLKGSDVE